MKGCQEVVRITGVFNKKSILHSILELEAELIEQENEALKLAEEKVHMATLSAEKLVKDTIKELPRIEEEERKRLLEEVNAKTVNLKNTDEKEFREFKKGIERNRKRALDLILKRLIPKWDGRYSD